jgi:hypothetical protein
MTVDAGPWRAIAGDLAEALDTLIAPCFKHPATPDPHCRDCHLNAALAAYKAMAAMEAEPSRFPGDPVAYARANATSPRAVELLRALEHSRAASAGTLPDPPAGLALPPGCNEDGTRVAAGERGNTGCLHHYPLSVNLAAEGCQCPAWFDFAGWHLVEYNPACRSPLHHRDANGDLLA